MAKFEGLQVAWLETFVHVADSGKRTAAAAELGINQATVTKHIQKLEQWLGGTDDQTTIRVLLFKDTVPATLLPAGERLLPLARQILQFLDAARQRLDTVEPPATPRVSTKHFKVPAPARPSKGS